MAPLPLREMVAVSIAQLCEAYQATVLFPFIVFMVESFDEGKNPRTVGALLAVRWPDSYSLRVPGVPCHLACLVFVPTLCAGIYVGALAAAFFTGQFLTSAFWVYRWRRSCARCCAAARCVCFHCLC